MLIIDRCLLLGGWSLKYYVRYFLYSIFGNNLIGYLWKVGKLRVDVYVSMCFDCCLYIFIYLEVDLVDDMWLGKLFILLVNLFICWI